MVSGRTGAGAAGGSRWILVADDDDASGDLATTALTFVGFDAQVATMPGCAAAGRNRQFGPT